MGWLFCVITTVWLQVSSAYNNGYGLKPFLGWQSWCAVGKCGTDLCTDAQVRTTAKAMVDNGLKDMGFEWVVIDDCWHPSRAENGTLIPYPNYFPNGMKPVVDYVHSLGLKFGLYTSVGSLTCHHGWSPGSFGHYQQDVDLFASWEVDYVKLDWCGGNKSLQGHLDFGKAMNQSSRQMVLELCRGPYRDSAKLPNATDWTYAPSVAQVWRAAGDHHDSWSHTLEQLAAIRGKGSWSGPYGWAYLDMMMIGGEGCANDPNPDKPQHCPQQKDKEYRSEASLYAIVSSPMMIGTDIRDMTPIMKECLLNKELIAINQDYLATPGDQINDNTWVRKLSNGNIAVAVTNMESKSKTVSIDFATVGWRTATATVRDIWAKQTLNAVQGNYGRKIGSHDTLLVVLSAASPSPPIPPSPPSPPSPPLPPSPPPPSPPSPGQCNVELTSLVSKRACQKTGRDSSSSRRRSAGTFGCTAGTTQMWVDGGCRGIFTCDGAAGIECDSGGEARTVCDCVKPAAVTVSVATVV